MPLPCLPCPPVERDQALCVSWLGLAYATVADTLIALHLRGTILSPTARYILTNLREWLLRVYRKEGSRRRDRRYRKICWEHTWFCHQKYLEVRSQLVCYGSAGQEVPLPTEPLPGVPTTAL